MGRPPKEINDEQLKVCLSLGADLRDCANFLDVSQDSIQRYIREKYDVTFAAFREEQLSKTKLSLIQSALMQAKKGNTALMIFALKNLAKWTDRIDISVVQPQKITLNYALKNSPHKELASEDEPIDVTPEAIDDKKEEG